VPRPHSGNIVGKHAMFTIIVSLCYSIPQGLRNRAVTPCGDSSFIILADGDFLTQLLTLRTTASSDCWRSIYS